MKKTAFDKIVVGFVFIVVIIFSVLVFFTIRNTQNHLFERTETDIIGAGNMLTHNKVADYISGKTTLTNNQSVP